MLAQNLGALLLAAAYPALAVPVSSKFSQNFEILSSAF